MALCNFIKMLRCSCHCAGANTNPNQCTIKAGTCIIHCPAEKRKDEIYETIFSLYSGSMYALRALRLRPSSTHP